MLGVTVIFFWFGDNVFKKYINEAFIMDVITILWGDEKIEWMGNMTQNYCDEYTSDPQYFPKCVLEYY